MLKFFMTGLIIFFTAFPMITNEVKAANWIKIIDTKENYLYLDSGSFVYDKLNNIAKFWAKSHNIDDQYTYIAYNYINFNDKTIATKSIAVYRNEKLVNNATYDTLEYDFIVPDSVGEEIYEKLSFFKYLSDNNINWTFNNSYIPEPSEIKSSFWEPIDSNKISFYDSLTDYNEDNGIKSRWEKTEISIDTMNLVSLKYIKRDEINNKDAILSEIRYKNGKIIENSIFPVIIWVDRLPREKLEKDKHFDAFLRQEALFSTFPD